MTATERTQAAYLRTYQLNKVGYASEEVVSATSLGPVSFNVTPTREGVED
jgi:hypothetical protein